MNRDTAATVERTEVIIAYETGVPTPKGYFESRRRRQYQPAPPTRGIVAQAAPVSHFLELSGSRAGV
jgi:hypothetical protein